MTDDQHDEKDNIITMGGVRYRAVEIIPRSPKDMDELVAEIYSLAGTYIIERQYAERQKRNIKAGQDRNHGTPFVLERIGDVTVAKDTTVDKLVLIEEANKLEAGLDEIDRRLEEIKARQRDTEPEAEDTKE